MVVPLVVESVEEGAALEVGADFEMKLATLLGTGAPADDDATAPPKLKPPAAPIMAIASPPEMIWRIASTTVATMITTAMTMCPMLVKRLFTLPPFMETLPHVGVAVVM